MGAELDRNSGNVALRISSKDSFDEGVLGGGGKEVLLLVFTVLGLVGGNMGKDIKTDNWGGGDRGTGDDIIRAVRDVEEGEVFNIVKGGPIDSRGWGVLEFGGLRNNGLEDARGDIKGTWVIPSIVRTLEDLEDGGVGVHNVLLVNVIKGRPGGDRDVGKGGGGDDGGLRGGEGHFTYTISSTLETVLMLRPTTIYGKQWATT